MSAPAVRLREVPREQASVLANLLELYTHDLSPYFPVTLGPDGRFGYAYLPRYWQEPDVRIPFFIEVDDRLAGFTLAMRGSPATGDATHLDVAEFFVLRAERRHGVGARAAALLWDRLPGHWTVRVACENVAAVAFWEGAVLRYCDPDGASRRWTYVDQGIERVVYELDTRASAR